MLSIQQLEKNTYSLLKLPPVACLFPSDTCFYGSADTLFHPELKYSTRMFKCLFVRLLPPAPGEAAPQPNLPSISSTLSMNWKCFSASQKGSASSQRFMFFRERGTRMQSRVKCLPCPRARPWGRWKGLTGKMKKSIYYKYCQQQSLAFAQEDAGKSNNPSLKGFTLALPSEGQVQGSPRCSSALLMLRTPVQPQCRIHKPALQHNAHYCRRRRGIS